MLKQIIYSSCIVQHDHSTKVRLRGRGSGYKEGMKNIESTEPLMLCISSLSYPTYCRCCQNVEMFLKSIYEDYYVFCLEKNIGNKDCVKRLGIKKYEFVVNRYPELSKKNISGQNYRE